ncbi:MAG: hypothetical protein EKK53_27260 [Burkholderiales bacterium]|nr:MAG: hypothetical protein EKK53_27260 [Burkholderiales bacterium]
MSLADGTCRLAGALMLLWSAALAGVDPAAAQTTVAPSVRMLTDAEVKAKYQNCPNGYYSGPRPGKARYTKDNFLWVVTPEFARKFCMPPQFISPDLKGAEAVAFRIVEDADEETCGWGGRAEVCARMKELRFEIYLPTGLLPKARDLPYYHAANLPSAMLLTQSAREFDASLRRAKAKPRPGALGPFEISQFGLDGIQGERVVWPIVGMHPQIFYEEVFEGINYLALQGSTGFFTNPRMEKLDVRRFVIVVRKLGDTKKSDDRALSEFAHVIELPEAFSDQVRAADKTRGMNVEELGKRALGLHR